MCYYIQSKLKIPLEIENKFKNKCKKIIIDEINNKEIDNKRFAEILNILPSGVDILLNTQHWSIETIIRIANALDLKIILDIFS